MPADIQAETNPASVTPEPKNRATREREVEPRYTTRRVDEHTWELGIAVPGVKREDVEISLEENELEVVAHRRSTVPESWRPVHLEFESPTSYRLQLTLGVEVDPDRISAKLEDGILTLRLPVAEAAKPRRISVE